MAIYPKAIKRLLPENMTQAKIKPRAIIAHSAGGEGELFGWWMNDDSKGLESHFWISRSGDVYQYIDTTVRADANGEANGFALSIETQSTIHASEPWDDKQLVALIDLIDWLCDQHDIPRRLMKDATDSGLAWHIQFGAPGPWTKARGKVCPGPARIKQFKEVVVPAIAKGGNVPTPTPEEDIIMNEETAKAIKAIVKEVIGESPAWSLMEVAEKPIVIVKDEKKYMWITDGIFARGPFMKDKAEELIKRHGLAQKYPNFPVVKHDDMKKMVPGA